MENIYVIEATQNGMEKVTLTQHLFNQRQRILLNSPVNADTANLVRESLLTLAETGCERCCIEINSPGGSVIDGLLILDTMDEVRSLGMEVDTAAVGMAASMAAVILAYGDHRTATKSSRILIHQVLGSISGQTTDVLIAAAEMKRDRQTLSEILAACSGQSLEQVTADTERDFWLTPEEALCYGKKGIIDAVLRFGKE